MPRAPTTAEVLRELGLRLSRARQEAGLTQEDAAAQAGIDYKRWQRVEQGQVNTTVRTLVRLADAVGVSFWELFVLPGSPAVATPRRSSPKKTKG